MNLGNFQSAEALLLLLMQDRVTICNDADGKKIIIIKKNKNKK